MSHWEKDYWRTYYVWSVTVYWMRPLDVGRNYLEKEFIIYLENYSEKCRGNAKYKIDRYSKKWDVGLL